MVNLSDEDNFESASGGKTTDFFRLGKNPTLQWKLLQIPWIIKKLI